MTDDTNQNGPPAIAGSADAGGERARRPYTRRASTREEDAERPAPRYPGKARQRRGEEGQNVYGIAPEILSRLWNDYGVDLQWNLDSVKGADGREILHDVPFATRVGMEQQGWESVMPGQFDGLLDGLFTRKDHEGETVVGGQVLQWRPIELTIEARDEERVRAKQNVGANEQRWKAGEIPGVDPKLFDPHNRHARAATTLTKTRVPTIPVPQ
jgi:hypothetical protein